MITFSVWMLVTSDIFWVMDSVNLVFHEAGHTFMMIFGETIMLLGGALFEVGIPLLLFLYFKARGELLSQIIILYWLSSALLSVSIYIRDAQERALPLITGDANTHDWWQLLSKYNLLNYDDVIANIVFLSSLVVVLYMLYASRHYFKFLFGEH